MATITTTCDGEMLLRTRVGQHVVASLGSCVAAYAARYCARAGIDDEGLAVDVMFDKAEDPTRLVNLRIVVRLPNGSCGDRLEALRRVQDRSALTTAGA
jgi:uncharacterized OsmC-like protein